MPSFIKRASQKAMKYQEPAAEKGEDLARLVKGNEQLLNRILTKKADSLGYAGRSVSHKTPGSVPFLWEAEPGKPKTAEELEACKPVKEREEDRGKNFPLDLPPSRRSSQTLSRAASSSLLQAPKSLSHHMTTFLNKEAQRPENSVGYSEIFSSRRNSSARNSFKESDIDFSIDFTHVDDENPSAKDSNQRSRKSCNEGRQPDDWTSSSFTARNSFKDSEVALSPDFSNVSGENSPTRDEYQYFRKNIFNNEERQPESCMGYTDIFSSCSTSSPRNSFKDFVIDFSPDLSDACGENFPAKGRNSRFRNSFKDSEVALSPDFSNVGGENSPASDEYQYFRKNILNNEERQPESCTGYADVFSSCSTSSARNSFKDFVIDFSPDLSDSCGENVPAKGRNRRFRNSRGTFDGVSDDWTSFGGSEYTETEQSSGSSSPISFSSFSSSSILSEDLPSLSSCSSHNSSIYMNFPSAKRYTFENSTDEQNGTDSSSASVPANQGTQYGRYSRSSSAPLGGSKPIHPSEKLLQTYQRKISRKIPILPENVEAVSSESLMEQGKNGNGLQKQLHSLNNLDSKHNVGSHYAEREEGFIYPKRGNVPSVPSTVSGNTFKAENACPGTINAKPVKKDGYDSSISAMPQKGLPFLRSQEISNMLLRLAKAEEELRFHGYDLDDDNLARPACLPICSFMGKSMMNRSKYLI